MLNWLGKLLRGSSSGAAPQAEPGALVQEALAQQQAGHFEHAERLFYRALALVPESAEIQLHLGGLFRQLGRHDAALDCCLEAVRLAPALAPAHNNLGNAYREAGQPDAAIGEFRIAIELDPGLAEAQLNLGNVLRERGGSQEAMQCYRAALQARPDFSTAQLNLGYLLQEAGDNEGAIAAYQAAIGLEPELVEAHVNLGMQLLLAGRYAEGWAEYEWRLRYPEYAVPAGAIRWDGGPLEGRRILLDAEQGFGDAIQFLRYAPLVAQRGGQVTVRCAPKLIQLFRGTLGVEEVVSRDAPAPGFDLHCPLPSLPLVFGTTVQSVPAPVPYLNADVDSAARWRARLAHAPANCRVGLVWASQSRQNTALARSIRLEALAPLAAVAGVRFYSLQRDAAARQAAHAPAGMQLEDLSGELRDFSDDAAVLANLDLLISVDTAIVHLAGAMGRPTWTLLKFAPDWRWVLGRDDSPWYPGMRLFRQRHADSWDSVIEELVPALRQFAAATEQLRQRA
jgi:Tfp pilus assembly protein PilF